MDVNLPLELISSLPVLSGLLCVFLLIPLAFYGFFPRSPFPLVNGSKLFEFGNYQSRKRFSQDATGLIQSGLRKADIFRLITQHGSQIVLAPKFAHEIRNSPGLDSTPAIMKESHSNIAGFEVMREWGNQGILGELIRTKITRKIAKLTEPLSVESSLLLKREWTDKKDWHAIPVHETVSHMVAQLSSLVFLGDEIYRNAEWHKIVISYTESLSQAGHHLNLWPKFIRPIVARFNPSCHNLRQQIVRAREVISPVLQKRVAAKETGVQKEHNDCLQWLDEVANGRNHDPVLGQIFLALAAIHSTTDLLSQALYDVLVYQNQESLVQELREEIISAVEEGGWQKGALQKLKLMDSVLKESLRLKPAQILGMSRHATQKVQLSDGNIIPKGSSTILPSFGMWDSAIYSDPSSFDPYRFLRLREAGDSSAHLVTPSSHHLGFGLGKHSCPGRFFAANEIKILFAHILLKYDIKLVDGCTPAVKKVGIYLAADPTMKIAIRRRQEEISLDI